MKTKLYDATPGGPAKPCPPNEHKFPRYWSTDYARPMNRRFSISCEKCGTLVYASAPVFFPHHGEKAK